MKKDTKQKIISGLIILIIIFLYTLYLQINNPNFNDKYADININSDELNIFYFNVGQADSTLITLNNKNI